MIADHRHPWSKRQVEKRILETIDNKPTHGGGWVMALHAPRPTHRRGWALEPFRTNLLDQHQHRGHQHDATGGAQEHAAAGDPAEFGDRLEVRHARLAAVRASDVGGSD